MKIHESITKLIAPQLFDSSEGFIGKLKQRNTYQSDIQKSIKHSSKRGDTANVFWATLKGRRAYLWPDGVLEKKITHCLRAEKVLFTIGLVTAASSAFFLNHGQAFTTAVFAGSVLGGATIYLNSCYESFEEQLALREIQKSLHLQKNAVHVTRIKASAH